MAETMELLSRTRESELSRARDARDFQARQEADRAAEDEYHHRIRVAIKEYGEKDLAFEHGCDVSMISNMASCERGRGYPQPWLLRKLRKKILWFAAFEMEDADYLPPQHKEASIDDAEACAEIERDVLPELGKKQAEHVRAILKRRRGSR